MNLEPIFQLTDAVWLFFMAAMGIALGVLSRQTRPSGINSLIAAVVPVAGIHCLIVFC